MNLPSFLWLWRIAAWSMGLSLTLYTVLAATGLWVRWSRTHDRDRPNWLGLLHLILGSLLITLVLLLLAIGIVGTLGHFGSLGHSWHLPAGLTVVALTLASGWSAFKIRQGDPGARSLHVRLNLTLLLGFVVVTATGWGVVQKYLP